MNTIRDRFLFWSRMPFGILGIPYTIGIRLLLLFFLSVFSMQVLARQDDSALGKPLIFLKEMNFFGLGPGRPDIPTFVLYEKGQVLYTTDRDENPKIHQVTLTQIEIQDLIKHFSISPTFYDLKEHIIGEGTSDLGDNILTVNLGQAKTVAVYGYLGDRGEARQKTPEAFLALYDQIRKYQNPNAIEWFPKTVRVYFEDYGIYFEDTVKMPPWIVGFPDLNSPTTKSEFDGYTVLIDGKKYDEFRKYYSSLGEMKAVEINRKRMMISYSIAFPNIP